MNRSHRINPNGLGRSPVLSRTQKRIRKHIPSTMKVRTIRLPREEEEEDIFDPILEENLMPERMLNESMISARGFGAPISDPNQGKIERNDFWGYDLAGMANFAETKNPQGFTRLPNATNDIEMYNNFQSNMAKIFNPLGRITEGVKASLQTLAREDEDIAFNGKFVVLSGQVLPLSKSVANRASSTLKIAASIKGNSKQILSANLIMKKMALYAAMNNVIKLISSTAKAARLTLGTAENQAKSAAKLRSSWLGTFIPVEGDTREPSIRRLPGKATIKGNRMDRLQGLVDVEDLHRWVPKVQAEKNRRDDLLQSLADRRNISIGDLKERTREIGTRISAANKSSLDLWVAKNLGTLLTTEFGNGSAVQDARYVSQPVPAEGYRNVLTLNMLNSQYKRPPRSGFSYEEFL